MNLIVEAGGTKSDLILLEKNQIISQFSEPSLNLSRESAEEFRNRLIKWNELINQPIDGFYLFAAGKLSQAKKEAFHQIGTEVFGSARIEFHSDLLGACYATAGDQSGIVGILGSGSNSCYYDGSRIIKTLSPGGFILGDEGSGASIGKRVLLDYLRGNCSTQATQILESELSLAPELIISQIYGGTIHQSSGFCNQVAKTAISNLSIDYFKNVCQELIIAYLNLLKQHYSNSQNQVFLVGSVAFYLRDIIQHESKKVGLELIKITQHPAIDLSLFLASKLYK